MSARRTRRRVRPGAAVGLSLVASIALAAAIGPLAWPHDPVTQDLDRALEPPSVAHPLGTDENGSDLLAQVVHGARLDLSLAALVVGVSLFFGLAIGALAGFRGGLVDETLMRLVDVLLSFPGILLNLAILAAVGRPSLGHMVFALCLNGWVGYARVARAQALALREREFVQSARAVGLGEVRILFRHVAPNLLGPLVVQASFGFAGVVLTEASLSFLGLGPPHGYTLGALMNQGATHLWHTHRLATVPGVAIAAVVLGFNLLGDALRDRFDPRLARS
jgi:peptide/nickel transport system permease protein